MMSFLGSHAYEMARKARSLVNSGCCHERPRLSFKNDQAGANTRGPRVARLDTSSVGQSGGTFPGCCKEFRAWPNRSARQDAFDRAGVVFLDPGDTRNGGSGVRLKQ